MIRGPEASDGDSICDEGKGLVNKGTREVGNHGEAEPMKTKQLVTTLSNQRTK